MTVKKRQQDEIRLTIIVDQLTDWEGGTENQLSLLLPRLPESWDRKFVVFRESPLLRQHAADIRAELEVFEISDFRSLTTYKNFFRLTQWLRATAPDVVHTFFPVANIFGVLAARLAGVPQIFSSRRDYGEWMSPRYFRATRFANRFVNGVITNSSRVGEMTSRMENVPKESILVIPNGIDADKFAVLPSKRESRAALGLPVNSFVVGLVANYRPMKRHQTLVLAAARLINSCPNLRFLLVGTNVTGEDIEATIRELANDVGVADRFLFSYSADDIRHKLSAMDVGVNCSEGEGLSNAIMEYMAAGIPCIATESGGTPDLIRHGSNGLLFRANDHATLARLIRHLIDNPGVGVELAMRAKSSIDKHYSISTMVEQFVDAYSRQKAIS